MWWGFAFVTWFFFLTLRLVYNLIQTVHWQFSGTFVSLTKTRRPGAHKQTVQRLRVLVRYKVDETLQPADLNNFILAHYDWIDPEYILKDTVSLYCLNQNEAVFVECFDGYDPHQHAFFTIGQYKFAKNVLIMPLHVFQRMADRIGNPKGEVVYIGMTSRCGSTLICDAFNKTGKCVVISEPFTTVLKHLKDKFSAQDFAKLVGDQMRVLCKPRISTGSNATYIIKMSPAVNSDILYLNKVFKTSKNIFMYRNGIPTVKSIYKVARASRFGNMSFLVNKVYPSLLIGVYNSIGFRMTLSDLNNIFCVFAGVWIKALEDYIALRHSGIEIPAFKYEDIMADPVGMTSLIFKHCGLDPVLAEEAVRNSFNQDSQRGTYLSRSSLGNHSEVKEKMSRLDFRFYVDNLCDELGLPRLDEDARLEGTITTRSCG